MVQYAVSGNVCTITMNRPEKRNALNPSLVDALKEAFTRAETDDQVKVIILTGGATFCAGADLEYLQTLQQFTYDENLADSTHLRSLFWQIYTHPKIVITQVEGYALAGGCGLVTVADFCFAAADARFGYTEVKIGFVPALVMPFLVRKIGEGRARQLLLTGTLVDAREAYRLGLVNCVCETQTLVQETRSFASSLIRANSGQAMKTTKQLLADTQSLTLQDALTLAAETNARVRDSADCRRGIAAFLKKQKTDWN